MNYQEINELLTLIKKSIQKSVNVKINNVILFGSQITGTSPEGSDYDILIILNDEFDWRIEDMILDVCFEIDLKKGIVSDIKIISQNELLTPRGKQSYIQNALKYGISA